MENKKYYWSGLVSGLLFALLVVSCAYVGTRIYHSNSDNKADIEVTTKDGSSTNGNKEVESIVNEKTLEKIKVLEDAVDQYYLKEVTNTQLENGIYEGILDSLGDPYSTYYTVEELEAIYEQTQGIYFGIGAYIGYDKESQTCTISKIIPNTPAEESDLMPGDIIYEVDGVNVVGKDSSEVVSLIKGKEGTKVTLTIIRDGASDYIKMDIERKKIESPTIVYEMLDNGIAYIEITEFDDITFDQFKEALTTAKGNDMKGLILDLRGNPGGNLSTVTEIARQILPEGLIVYTEDKYGERVEYSCDGSKKIAVPLVVLVDGGSASASEILAGAIKDYGVGKLLGTTTFGKGIVQRIISLSDGTAIKVTVSKYYTPKGNNIHEIGIVPDEELKWDSNVFVKDGTDNQKDRAIEIIKEQIQ